MLRPQQIVLKNYIDNIKNRAPISDIICMWSVGSGKSSIPVLLSDLLDYPHKKLVWISPRDSLKYQAEEAFQCDFLPTNKTIRPADNSPDPFRGCDCCSITYQAIIANPTLWISIFKKYDIILFADEYHHLSETGSWGDVFKELYHLSKLRVFASGTLERGDRTKVPFTPYVNNKLDYRDTINRKWVIYNHNQSLKDGNSVPFKASLIGGSGSYIDKTGIQRSFEGFSGKGDQLITALSTEYAYSILDLSIKTWQEYKVNHPWAKLLIVSPSISIAKDYLEYVQNKGLNTDIATSDDSPGSKKAISNFKKSNILPGSIHILITVNQAYEGLDVKEVAVMAILTLIRSVPWLFQCIGRSTRVFKDKKESFIYAPDDPKMRAALKLINGGIIQDADGEIDTSSSNKKPEESNRPAVGIQALSSQAHIPQEEIQYKLFAPEITAVSQSDKEKGLRQEINSIVNSHIGKQTRGNKKTKETLIWLNIKRIVNNGRDSKGILQRKKLGEMTIPELEKVLTYVKQYS